jgi:hypothetical protein
MNSIVLPVCVIDLHLHLKKNICKRSRELTGESTKLGKETGFLSIFYIFLLTSLVHLPALSASPFAGSIESDLSVTGEVVDIDDETGRVDASVLEPSWSVRPTIDYRLNESLFLGVEVGMSWFSAGEVTGEGTRLSIAPHLRGRMDFPIDCRWTIEGLLSFGFVTWGSARGVKEDRGGGRRWGGGMRIQLGLRYAINTKVHALLAGSYVSQETYYGENGTLEYQSFPIVIGIRGGF